MNISNIITVVMVAVVLMVVSAPYVEALATPEPHNGTQLPRAFTDPMVNPFIGHYINNNQTSGIIVQTDSLLCMNDKNTSQSVCSDGQRTFLGSYH